MSAPDLVIRNATLVDGSGAPPVAADVAVAGGRIAAVGKVEAAGRREVDAGGHVVAPGWVDIHTHYDGQATWDPYLSPSCWHGVTTAVMGNCGVGFAPVRDVQRDWAIELMEGVEDIPGAVLHEGVQWTWETFPQYLDALEKKPHAIDVAAQVPHGAVRVYVMGDRGRRREKATGEELSAMAGIVRDAIRAGALGFSSSRAMVHKSSKGESIPSLDVPAAEYKAIAAGVREAGTGVLQMISDFEDLDAEFALMRDAAREAGRPLSFTLLQNDRFPGRWREILRRVAAARAEGVDMKAQVACRPIGLMLGLQCTMSPFMFASAYQAIAMLPLAERVARLRDPAVRAAILADNPDPGTPRLEQITRAHHKHFPLDEGFSYEPDPADSMAARAERAGVPVREYVYDFMLRDEGRQLMYCPLYNYADGDLEAVREMMADPNSLLGLGDGGAHNGYICDSSYPTFLISHWTRDRTRGGRLPLEWLVRRQTRANALAMGLSDRGLVAPGMKADLNVIDLGRLRASMPTVVNDLPAGGRRFVQRAEGYRMTIVSGVPVFEEGEPTGAMPGALVRGAR